MTDKQKQKYLKKSSHCPYCNSDQLEGGAFDFEGDGVYSEITCNKCNKKWWDVYTLTNIQE